MRFMKWGAVLLLGVCAQGFGVNYAYSTYNIGPCATAATTAAACGQCNGTAMFGTNCVNVVCTFSGGQCGCTGGGPASSCL